MRTTRNGNRRQCKRELIFASSALPPCPAQCNCASARTAPDNAVQELYGGDADRIGRALEWNAYGGVALHSKRCLFLFRVSAALSSVTAAQRMQRLCDCATCDCEWNIHGPVFVCARYLRACVVFRRQQCCDWFEVGRILLIHLFLASCCCCCCYCCCGGQIVHCCGFIELFKRCLRPLSRLIVGHATMALINPIIYNSFVDGCI